MVRGARFIGLVLVSVALGCGGKSVTAPAGSTPGGPSSPGPTSSRTASIGVQDVGFAPSVDTVRAGTVVTWSNGGSLAHTVTSDGGLWNSGQISSAGPGGVDAYGYQVTAAAGSYQQTFSSPGSYSYHCSNHAFMTGTIVVTP